MFEDILEMQTSWEYFKSTGLPIVCYGTGNGADKILDEFARLGITPAAVMASDGFVRNRSFRGFKVKSLAECEAEFDAFCVAVCFGTQRNEVIKHIKEIAEKHKTLVPTAAVCGTQIFNRAFFTAHQKSFADAYLLLADEASKITYSSFLRFSLSGELSFLFQCESPKEEAFRTILRLGPHERYLDLGAYRGDTVQEFLHYCGGSYDKIIAAEPDSVNFKKLSAYTADLNKTELHNCAVWNQKQDIPFAKSVGRGSAAKAQSETTVPADSADGILNGRAITYIKADVEGAESEMLDGAAYTLKTYKPKLNIAAYHKCNAVPELALKIHALNPDYKIHLRHHPHIPCWDLNLYCV